MKPGTKSATVGVAGHAGWAVLVTVAGAALVDRRRAELVGDDLPSLPHHHACQALPMPKAVELVARVRASAERHALEALDALARDVSHDLVAIALRACPSLPDTVEERITNYRAQNVADTVMYRHALAKAATQRGWRVSWYEPKRVFAEAASALRRETIEDLLEKTGAALGPPWRKDHRMAMAAAIAAARSR
jgi:hypothetical protein